MRIAEIFASYRKSVTSDFRPEVEMRNASGHYYLNSSFIMDVAVGRYHVPQNAFLVIHSFIHLFVAFISSQTLRSRLPDGHTTIKIEKQQTN